MQPRFRPLVPVLLLIAPIRLCAQETAVRFPVTANEISQLLLGAGTAVDPTDIELPLPLSTAVPSPHLAITGADLAGDAHVRLRIASTVGGECLPFFALVNFHDNQHASAVQSILASSFPTDPRVKHTSASVLRAGDRAVLLLEDKQMQISLSVVTIDSGTVGTEIRVASLDRKQTYRAVVVRAGIVRGVLP